MRQQQQQASSDILMYERPALTADCVVLRIVFDESSNKPSLQVRLVKRPNSPECGKLALIGAFVPVEERIDDVLVRCVRDKGGVEDFYFEQLYTFDTPGRDERWRVISVAHIGIVSPDADILPVPNAAWYDIDMATHVFVHSESKEIVPFDALAFDHEDILNTALSRLQGKVLWTDIIFRFMPETFSVPQLKQVLQLIAQKPVNNVKRDFGKYLVLEESPEKATLNKENGASPPKRPAHRPSALYKFTSEQY